MKITNGAADQVVLTELGGRLASMRLDRNLTQDQLAREAGISLRTLRRMESGEVAPQLTAFIRVCRVLGLLDRFEVLVPESAPGPLAQLQLKGRTRRRASAPKSTGPASPVWKWGDQT